MGAKTKRTTNKEGRVAAGFLLRFHRQLPSDWTDSSTSKNKSSPTKKCVFTHRELYDATPTEAATPVEQNTERGF